MLDDASADSFPHDDANSCVQESWLVVAYRIIFARSPKSGAEDKRLPFVRDGLAYLADILHLATGGQANPVHTGLAYNLAQHHAASLKLDLGPLRRDLGEQSGTIDLVFYAKPPALA